MSANTQQEFTVFIDGRHKLKLPDISIANTIPHHVVRSQQIIDALSANVPARLLSNDPDIGDVPISVRWANVATFARTAQEANNALFLNGVSAYQAGNNITLAVNGTAVVISALVSGGANSVFAESANTANTANTANFLNGVSGYQAGAGIVFTANGAAFVISANVTSVATALIANNALFLNGVSAWQAGNNITLTANGTALVISSNNTVNNALFFNGQPDTFYLNASNLLSGTVPAGLLPLANTTVNGAVSTVAQSFAGVKTFTANTEFSGYANIAGKLVVAGLSTLTGNTEHGGYVNVASTLQVAGLTTLTGNATLSGFANVAGKLVVAGLSTQTGNAEFGGYVNVATTLQVAGTTLFNGVLTANANVVANGIVTFMKGVVANTTNGTAGQVLTSGGNGANVYWSTVTAGGSPDANSTTAGLVNTSIQILSGAKTWLGIATFGAGLVANGANGTSGQVLTSGGNGANVYWSTASGGSPDANSTTAGLVNTSIQILAGRKTWLNTATFGAGLVANGANGTAGQVLTSGGDAGNVYWSTAASGGSPFIFDNGNSGATKTINWNNGVKQSVTMNASCVFSFTNPVVGATYVLILNTGTGGFSITLPGTVQWPAQGVFTLTAPFANRKDLLTFLWDGVNYMASTNRNYLNT